MANSPSPVRINERHEVLADIASNQEVDALVTDVKIGRTLSLKLSLEQYYIALDFLSFHDSDSALSMLEAKYKKGEATYANAN